MYHITIDKAAGMGIAAAIVALLLVAEPGRGDTKKTSMLHIGTTEAGVEENVPEGCDEKTVEDTHRHFIQAITGFRSDIVALEDHEVLADRLASGKLQLGFFMGYEFVWAQARHPKLKVLAYGVNRSPFQYAALVVRRDDSARGLADLKGKTLALPRRGQGYGRLFVAAQCRLAGLAPGAFLGHIDSVEDVETLLDDIVDGKRQAAVVDRASLDAYQRRKPRRFDQLKKLSESPPMLPPLIADHDGKLDPQTVTRLRDKLTTVGEVFLMLCHLTHFAPPSRDFDRVLADTRKAYPAPALRKRTEAHAAADWKKRPQVPLGPNQVAATSNPDKKPRQGEPEYYLCVFACDSVPPRPSGSHTFATFIKANGGSVEAHTISWLPKSKHIVAASTQGEPGMNLDLPETLRLARSNSSRVCEWGPYRIRPALYERGLRQIKRLNSGRIQYKALDGVWHPDSACNCIHAVSDIDTDNGALTVDGVYGAAASALVVEHLSHWMIQPGREHPSMQEKLGISGQPITRIAYKGEPAAK